MKLKRNIGHLDNGFYLAPNRFILVDLNLWIFLKIPWDRLVNLLLTRKHAKDTLHCQKLINQRWKYSIASRLEA